MLADILVNAIGEILNRKTSVAQIMSKTVEGLNHAYELRDSSPEDLIFDLFKMPNKDEASISKLIKVWSLLIFKYKTCQLGIGHVYLKSVMQFSSVMSDP